MQITFYILKESAGLVLRRPAVLLPPYQKDNTGILLNCFDFSYCRQGQTASFEKPPNLI